MIRVKTPMMLAAGLLSAVILSVPGATARAAEDTTWQNDYYYTLETTESGREIVLSEHKQAATPRETFEVVLPAKAVIDGVEYTTVIGERTDFNISPENSARSFLPDEVSSFRVEEGVKARTLERLVYFSDSGYESTCLRELDLRGLDTSDVTSMKDMLGGNTVLKSVRLDGIDTSNVTDMSGAFSGCLELEEIDLSGLDTSKVTDMSRMFASCDKLRALDLTAFQTDQVTTMASMFHHCVSLTSLDVSSFHTGNVTTMRSMFEYCNSLEDLDLSSFDTGRVTDMSLMFRGCGQMKELNLSSFNTTEVTTMLYMFYECGNLSRPDVTSFRTDNLVAISHMFEYCGSMTELDLGSFDLSALPQPSGGGSDWPVLKNCDALKKLRTPVHLSAKIPLPHVMVDENGVEYNELPQGLESSILLTAERNLEWETVDGKSYWYENNVRQGTKDDEKCFSYEGTLRGREIYDRSTDGWYWLDVNADGAKATGKEVFMPYVYENEDSLGEDMYKAAYAKMSDPGLIDYVYSCMINKTGKWVRYDENGKMLKGWVEITGTLAELYPEQKGNTYYYDTKTGLMAKGDVAIDGNAYHFDEVTGALQK